MNNKSIRLQLIQYLHDYHAIKNKKIVKKGRKIKTEADVLKDMQSFCTLAKKEVSDLRKDLKDKMDILMKKADEKKMKEILEELENYTNANEEAIIMNLINLLENFEIEKNPEKRKEILIKTEDFVYDITSNEKIEISWDLFAFLQECFFIYYNHGENKAEIEYGVNSNEDKQIERGVKEKLDFLREVTAD